MAGLIEGGGVEGDDINCVNPGVSAANVLIDRPPACPFTEDEELLAPAAARGRVPVDTVPDAVGPDVVAEVGATPTVPRGTVGTTLLINDDGVLD